MNALCVAVHDCNDREGRCTRLAHTNLHHCFWCGKSWTDQPARAQS